MAASRSAAERKHTDLTLSQKVEVVQLVQEIKLPQITNRDRKRLKCSQSTVSKIVENKDAILGESDDNEPHSRKRKRSGKAKDVEGAIWSLMLKRETGRLQA